jgi:hypothetical protein
MIPSDRKENALGILYQNSIACPHQGPSDNLSAALAVTPVAGAGKQARHRKCLEHVPEKLTDFSDQNMLQEIDFERILIDRMIPSDRNTL